MRIVTIYCTFMIYSSLCITLGEAVSEEIKTREPDQDLEVGTADVSEQLSQSSSSKEATTKFEPAPKQWDTFETLRLSGRRFIDNTVFIRKLIDEHAPPGVYLLTRPRRFGKTTFLKMLERFFKGHAKYFNGTEIYSRGNDIQPDGGWKSYPVILVDFQGMTSGLGVKDFIRNLRNQLKEIAGRNELPMLEHGSYWTIDQLIYAMERKYSLPVSVLIDNYDDPLIQPYQNKTDQESVMHQLVCFYNQVKRKITILRLVFILGISRLNKIHRAWNGFVKDISYKEEFRSILGFTWEEVTSKLGPNIEKFANDTGTAEKDILYQIPQLYGMYRFSPQEKSGLLIPSGSLCECLDNQKLQIYLPSSPAFDYVVDEMKKWNLNVDEFKFKEISLEYFDTNFIIQVKKIPLEVFMLCNGFLTINSKQRFPKEKTVILTYPSWEIEESFRLAVSDDYKHFTQYSNETIGDKLP